MKAIFILSHDQMGLKTSKSYFKTELKSIPEGSHHVFKNTLNYMTYHLSKYNDCLTAEKLWHWIPTCNAMPNSSRSWRGLLLRRTSIPRRHLRPQGRAVRGQTFGSPSNENSVHPSENWISIFLMHLYSSLRKNTKGPAAVVGAKEVQIRKLLFYGAL